MHRIYFDTNEGAERGYGLWLDASKRDLNRIPNGPKNSMHVVIYMTGKVEMEAVLWFMPGHPAWIARPILQTTKYLD